MNKNVKGICFTLVWLVSFSFPVFAEEISNNELMQELKTVKERIEKLETSHEKKDDEIKVLREGIVKLREEKGIDIKIKEDNSGFSLTDNITLSGLIEVEAAYESLEFRDPAAADTDSSDITLATVELGIDAAIIKHVSGHVLLLWEEDDTEPVDIDEGIITISGEDVVPLYLDAGKMYAPFGLFESHFISDPLTLEIGETRESAVRIGFVNDIFDISLTFFNGDIDETGDDDEISTFVGSAVFTLSEGTIPDLCLIAGISYISNIADSDGLGGEVAGPLVDSVGGIGLFLSASFMESLFFEVEYVDAIDKFAAGELNFDNGMACEPGTYNFEFAWALKDDLELGVKYEGSDDLGAFLPEKQYGCVLNYSLFKNTSLGIEYLHGEYENDDERDLFTFQIAVEF